MKRNWFLPENPDVLDMLCRQASITCEGMVALVAWANAEPDAAQRVRDLEHQADDTKRELRLALTNAFITPIDAEDVREALTVPAHIPVMIMDARRRLPVIETLLALVGHALDVSPE